ncbi:hypothetical protein [Halostagnicola bangensis]
MMKGKILLIPIILISNFAIIGGAAVFGWSPLTVVALFVFDALLGAIRISVERLFAGKPRGNAQVPTYPIFPTQPIYHGVIYESLLDKRGVIRLRDWIPKLYPRNIPYALEWWVFIAAFGFCLGITWLSFGPIAGTIDESFGLVLALITTRHVSIIVIWQTTNQYEQASAPTVRRRRELLFSFAIAFIAIVFVGSQPAGSAIIVAATIPLVPKLLFDFREAGIGPDLLVFDPSSDTATQPLPIPAREPRHVFQNGRRGVYNTALFLGVLHMLAPGLAIIAVFGLIAVFSQSLLVGLIGVIATLLIALSIDYVAMWLAYGNVEYRVYGEVLVAYDHYLEEPQWVVSSKDLTTITTKPEPLKSQIIPSVNAPVEIECATDESFRLEYLDQPEEFVRSVRGTMTDHSAVT